MKQEAKAVLLVGGLGTRLRTVVPSMPKPLARVGGSSFLSLLLRQLASQGVHDVVLCTGYSAEQIENELGDGARWGVSIEYSREPEPLGTGGAIRLAKSRLEQQRFFVLNGDSFVDVDFTRLCRFHTQSGGMATVVAKRVNDTSRFGTLGVDAAGRIGEFLEKSGLAGPGLINAGVYLFEPSILDRIPEGNSSLERDILPALLTEGVYAFEQEGLFIDIGIPEDYARAQAIHEQLRMAASRRTDAE